MPIMDVSHSAGSLDATTKAALAARLTEVLIAMEGGANTEGGRNFAWVFFREFAADDLWVAGQSVGPDTPRFVVHVSIPEGYMNRPHKNEVHRWVAEAVAAAVGRPEAMVMTVIDEVPEGNWGARGAAISLEAIATTVGQPADGPRMRWSHDYFAAKARALAAAGYPADLGGLPASLAPTS